MSGIQRASGGSVCHQAESQASILSEIGECLPAPIGKSEGLCFTLVCPGLLGIKQSDVSIRHNHNPSGPSGYSMNGIWIFGTW